MGEHKHIPLLAVSQRNIDWLSLLGNKPVISQANRTISSLLTLVLGFALHSCNNNNITLILGYS